MRKVHHNTENLNENCFVNLIETDLIRSLHFPMSEVLMSIPKINERWYDLERLKLKGNYPQVTLRIHFEDVEGQKHVITKILGVSDDYLIIKTQLTIPIHRITQIVEIN